MVKSARRREARSRISRAARRAGTDAEGTPNSTRFTTTVQSRLRSCTSPVRRVLQRVKGGTGIATLAALRVCRSRVEARCCTNRGRRLGVRSSISANSTLLTRRTGLVASMCQPSPPVRSGAVRWPTSARIGTIASVAATVKDESMSKARNPSESTGSQHNKLGVHPPTQKNEGRRTPASRNDRESQAGSLNQAQQRRGRTGG